MIVNLIARHSLSALIVFISLASLANCSNAPRADYEKEEEESSGVNQDDVPEEDRFSYSNHQEDHSIYSGRALMSADRIDHSTFDEEELEPLKKKDYVEKEWQLMFRSLDMIFEGTSDSVLQEVVKSSNIMDDILANLRPECRRDMYHLRESMKKHKLWALRMIDSNGKIPSGVTYGRFSSPGDYQECIETGVDESVYSGTTGQREHHKFRGKYCLLDFRLPMPERPKDRILSIHDPVLDLRNTEILKTFPDFANYTGYASVLYEAGYMHAVCIPSTCDIMDLARSVGQALEGMHIIVNNTVDCEQKFDEPQPLRTSQKIAIGLLTLVFANAFFATFLSYMKPSAVEKNHQSSSAASAKEAEAQSDLRPARHSSGIKGWAADRAKTNSFYVECFSIQSNFKKLTKPDPRGLTFVHYTRIIAMGLTVITHTAALGTLQAITKPADASNSDQMFRDFIPQMLANAFSSIQIFFFMAGFMLVVSTYPAVKKNNGQLSFVEYAVKRAIRLMPGLAATVCLNFLWPLIVDGPMLSYFIRLILEPCETNWWRTLGFLSNFDHVEKMCLRHSYFSASDYQLHIMAFPLLILLYKQPYISLFIAAILTIAGFAAQVIMVLTKTVLPFMMVDYLDKEAFFNVVHYIHHPVWNHMAAFFYGFIVGYLVVKQIRINISEKTTTRIWYTLVPAGVISIFAPYFWNHYKRPIYRWQMVLYVIFDRFILLTTCAWLSYASMVLARKPRAKPARPTEPRKSVSLASTNLPSIVTIGSERKLSRVSEEPTLREQLSAANTSNLQAPSLPRQRSSPSLCEQANLEGPTLRPALSSSNIRDSSESLASSKRNQPQATHQVAADHQPPKQNKPSGPISDINTLCLTLSRLTFQLYLFNMVVLWVDVNHSKYYWFFSYYFIITKAFAIYFASAIMATIFFVTMESPCLSLYIAWVNGRSAQRRKNEQNTNNQPNQQQFGGHNFANSTTATSGRRSAEPYERNAAEQEPSGRRSADARINYIDSPVSDQTRM